MRLLVRSVGSGLAGAIVAAVAAIGIDVSSLSRPRVASGGVAAVSSGLEAVLVPAALGCALGFWWQFRKRAAVQPAARR